MDRYIYQFHEEEEEDKEEEELDPNTSQEDFFSITSIPTSRFPTRELQEYIEFGRDISHRGKRRGMRLQTRGRDARKLCLQLLSPLSFPSPESGSPDSHELEEQGGKDFHDASSSWSLSGIGVGRVLWTCIIPYGRSEEKKRNHTFFHLQPSQYLASHPIPACQSRRNGGNTQIVIHGDAGKDGKSVILI